MFSRGFRRCSLLFNPTPEHVELRKMVSQFVASEVEPQALSSNRAEAFNQPLFRRLGQLGLLGPCVASELGGADMDPVALCIIHEELSASDPSFCLSYLAHSVLFVHNLYVNGSPAQKSLWLPKALSGDLVCGMAMSEAEAGTDVLALKTRGQPSGSSYVLNGSKLWITNGYLGDDLGDAFLVYARTGSERSDVSLFLVEKGRPGFALGSKILDKCGMRASNTAELLFDEVELPEAARVGPENGATTCMMRNLAIERVALAAMGLGIARRSLEVMISYAEARKTFGRSIGSHGQIQAHIANSFADYQAARTYVYHTAAQLDIFGADASRVDSDGVKLVATSAAKRIADSAMQVLGGNGYCGEYVVERLWRDAKLLEIGGGTLEAHQKNITRDLLKLVREQKPLF